MKINPAVRLTMAALSTSRGCVRLPVMEPMEQVVIPRHAILAVQVEGQKGFHRHLGQTPEQPVDFAGGSELDAHEGLDLGRYNGGVTDQELKLLDGIGPEGLGRTAGVRYSLGSHCNTSVVLWWSGSGGC